MGIKKMTALCNLGLEVSGRMASPRISKVNLALTLKCNHRCISCEIWKENNSNNNEIKASDVEKLLNANDLMWVALTGGEPFLNKEIKDILALCLKKLKLTNITSNGELPERIETTVRQALSTTKDSLLVIHLSLFGRRQAHDRMTGTNGAYDRAIETMQRLKKLKNDRLILGFEHMLSNENSAETLFVRDKSKELGVGITYTVEQRAGYYNNNTKPLVVPPKPPVDFSINTVDIFKNTFLNRIHYKKKMKCVAGEYSCFIMPDKSVYPCLFAIPERKSFVSYRFKI